LLADRNSGGNPISIKNILITSIPEPIKQILRRIRYHLSKKNTAELTFWRGRLKVDKGKFNNSFYERMMLAMAEESNDNFLKGKIVADFGCGPRGSLVWASSASLRIGIDVIADRYANEFTDNIISHEMIYLKSTENVIPLPSDFVDIMFTLNAMDHVDNFSVMCNEIMRVIKPGGQFIGSFNLEGPVSTYEPQQLNENIIKENLLNNLEVQSYRISKKGPEENLYAPFFHGNLFYKPGQEGYLWVRGKKKSS
jgi:SAM-dependent methyltransferase